MVLIFVSNLNPTCHEETQRPSIILTRFNRQRNRDCVVLPHVALDHKSLVARNYRVHNLIKGRISVSWSRFSRYGSKSSGQSFSISGGKICSSHDYILSFYLRRYHKYNSPVRNEPNRSPLPFNLTSAARCNRSRATPASTRPFNSSKIAYSSSESLPLRGL